MGGQEEDVGLGVLPFPKPFGDWGPRDFAGQFLTMLSRFIGSIGVPSWLIKTRRDIGTGVKGDSTSLSFLLFLIKGVLRTNGVSTRKIGAKQPSLFKGLSFEAGATR